MLPVPRLKAALLRCALALSAVLAASLTGASGVAAAATHVMAWGGNEWGQLGNGTRSESGPVQLVSGLNEPVAVAAGHHHSLALLSNGTVMAWGSNQNGELGTGTTTPSAVPVAVSGLSEVTAISAGSGFSVALLRNGTVMTWGANEWGQLGDGTREASPVPVAVKGVSEVTAISAGRRFVMALLRNGNVKMWGYDGSPHEGGELGQGTPIGPEVCAHGREKEHAGIARARHHERAVASRKAGESVYCSAIAVQVIELSGVTAIGAGSTHSLAVLANGEVVGWGANSLGELGVGRKHLDGGKNRSWVPVHMLGVSGAVAVSGGDKYSLVLLRNGTVLGAGKNLSGEIGDGTTSNKRRAVGVSGLTGAIAISAGSGQGGAAHSLALLGNGTVMSWGANNKEQLGDGSTVASSVPVMVKGLSAVSAISGKGTSHSLALASK
jgi:alpha-tubulin suppressor-like RCC1 family protein